MVWKYTRKQQNKRLARGSRGVNWFSGKRGTVTVTIILQWNIQVLDSDVEDMLWICLSSKVDNNSLIMAVCYFPPESSSYGRSSEEKMQHLSEQVHKFKL